MKTAILNPQLMANPEISGIEYQQGELQGYEVREYLLEKFGRKCAYCGAENVPLEVEHIIPKSRGRLGQGFQPDYSLQGMQPEKRQHDRRRIRVHGYPESG